MQYRKVPEELIFQRNQPFPSPAVRAKFLDYHVAKHRPAPLSVAGILSFYSAFCSAFRRITGTDHMETPNGIVNDVLSIS